jgi:uncharacterized BrkB/YihY/UPF0761 family membrane protein
VKNELMSIMKQFKILVGMALLAFCSISLAIVIGLAIASIVPQYPFQEKNITLGVCLIVFSGLISIIVGIIGAYFCIDACETHEWDEC